MSCQCFLLGKAFTTTYATIHACGHEFDFCNDYDDEYDTTDYELHVEM